MQRTSLTRRGLLTSGVVIGVSTLAACTTGNSPKQPAVLSMIAWPTKDIWPDFFEQVPAEIQEAYRYAASNHDTLRWMPCFCGCGENGHHSNFDCYVREVHPDGSVLLDPMSLN